MPIQFTNQLAHCRATGDLIAINGLIQSLVPPLRSVCAGILEPFERATYDGDDLLQEVATAAIFNFGQFRGETEAELRSWMTTILKNRLNNKRRAANAIKRGGEARKVSGDRSLDDPIIHLIPDNDPSPSSQARRRERDEIVREAVNELPDQYRQAVTLWYFDQLCFKDVGAQLGCTAEAARKLCERGVIKLRERLKQ